MENPRLVEPSMKNYLHTTLQNCHNMRVKLYTTIFNVVIFLLFVFVMGGTLYYCYKRKPTPYENYQKMMRDQETILSKIRYYQNERINHHQTSSSITNLPYVEDPIESLRI
jgi:hypothetical protein